MKKYSVFVDHLETIKNKVAWSVQKGHGSFITLEFGNPHLVIREPKLNSKMPTLRKRRYFIVGDYQLWIQNAEWQILDGEKIISDNEKDSSNIAEATKFIDGQILKYYEFDIATKSIFLVFDEEGRIRIKLDKYPDLQISMYFFNKKSVHLTYGGDLEIENNT